MAHISPVLYSQCSVLNVALAIKPELDFCMPLILTSMLLFVDALIPHLANVNVTDRAGRTSLHHAAFNGHVEVQIMCTVHSKRFHLIFTVKQTMKLHFIFCCLRPCTLQFKDFTVVLK